MIQRYLALMTVMMLLGLSSPALAGDLVSPQLTASLSADAVRPYIPGRLAAFSFQAPSQTPSQLPAAPVEKHWTKGGKIMTFIGLGLVAAGVGLMFVPNTTVSSSCNSSSCSETQINWKATGGGIAGGGAVLMIIGLTRRH